MFMIAPKIRGVAISRQDPQSKTLFRQACVGRGRYWCRSPRWSDMFPLLQIKRRQPQSSSFVRFSDLRILPVCCRETGRWLASSTTCFFQNGMRISEELRPNLEYGSRGLCFCSRHAIIRETLGLYSCSYVDFILSLY